MAHPVFKHIHVNGKVTLKRDDTMTKQVTMNVVIMGPTGAGKSSFIEALCGDSSLGISKDQLEGYTQEVAAYVLVNAMHNDHSPICIIDTPGFADRKISEMEIATKINKFLKANMARANYILFLTPITDIRLSGSRRRTIDTFKSLVGIETANQITVVTTMWNQLHTEDAVRQANQRLRDLPINAAYKDLIDRKTTIQKFTNTQNSALQIIDAAVSKDSPYMFEMDNKISGDSRYMGNLVSDLDARIQQLCYQETNLMDDLAQVKLDRDSDPILLTILEEKLAEVGSDLERFGRERIQLDGIKQRTEIDGLLERLPRQFTNYVLELQKQSENHDWDTNQHFQPLPPPSDFLLLMPSTLTPSLPLITVDGQQTHGSVPAGSQAQTDTRSESILLISSLEERAKQFHQDLDHLKQQLTSTVSPSLPTKIPTQEVVNPHGQRRKWLDSMKSWKESKLWKDYNTRK